MRASQLDAGRLDSELTSILQEQFLKAFSLMQPVRTSSSMHMTFATKPFFVSSDKSAQIVQRVVNALKPEFSLLLDFLVSPYINLRTSDTSDAFISAQNDGLRLVISPDSWHALSISQIWTLRESPVHARYC